MLAPRYHDTVVTLHVVDRLSPRTLAGRFGASVEEVRAVLVAAGALDTSAMKASGWRNSSETHYERRDERLAPAPRYYDEADRDRADCGHINAVIRALGGHGFPFLQIGRA